MRCSRCRTCTLRPPAVLQVVPLRSAQPRRVERSAIPSPFRLAGVRDPKESSGFLHLRDERRPDSRRRQTRRFHSPFRSGLRLGREIGTLRRTRGRRHLGFRRRCASLAWSQLRTIGMMPVLQVEAPRVSDLRLPPPLLPGHGHQAPVPERASRDGELGAVRRDGVGAVLDASEECELPVIQRRPRVHGNRRTVLGLLGTSRAVTDPGRDAYARAAWRQKAAPRGATGSRISKITPSWLPNGSQNRAAKQIRPGSDLSEPGLTWSFSCRGGGI